MVTLHNPATLSEEGRRALNCNTAHLQRLLAATHKLRHLHHTRHRPGLAVALPRDRFSVNYVRIYISAPCLSPVFKQTGPAWSVVMILRVSTLSCPSAMYLSRNIYRIERLNPPAIWSPGAPAVQLTFHKEVSRNSQVLYMMLTC